MSMRGFKWVGAAFAVLLLVALLAGLVRMGTLKLDFWPDLQAVLGPKVEVKKTPPTLEFTPQEVTQARRQVMASRLEWSGPLVAPQTVTLRAKSPGSLLSLQVSEGSRVKAGQVLGRIELADLGSRVAEREAQQAAARTALTQAERTHAQNERMATQQFISSAALDNSRSAVDAARAQLAAAQASVNTTRVGLRDGTLVSPIQGVVAKRHALPGERLAMEQAVLTVVDLSTLELAGSVGTHEVSRLTPGMAVQVRVEGQPEPVAGRIARIAPAAEPGTRAIGVTVALANPQERFRAGQYALAQVDWNDPQPRLTLPLSALSSNNGVHQVWVLQGGQLRLRSVTLGLRDDALGRVEIKEGLNLDTTVLALRFENLRDGAAAVVVDNRSAAGAGAASAAATAASTASTASAATAAPPTTAASAAAAR